MNKILFCLSVHIDTNYYEENEANYSLSNHRALVNGKYLTIDFGVEDCLIFG